MFLQTWVLIDRLPSIPFAMATLGYLFFPPFGFLVLYSRLHLLLASKRVLKFVLTIIILECALAEFPMALLQLLSIMYPNSKKIAIANKFSWEFEEAIYPTVDFTLCFLYILQVKRIWGHSEDKMKGVLRHVIAMTAIFVLVDISWVVIQNVADYDWADSVEVGIP
jgi:hypothetical protein